MVCDFEAPGGFPSLREPMGLLKVVQGGEGELPNLLIQSNAMKKEKQSKTSSTKVVQHYLSILTTHILISILGLIPSQVAYGNTDARSINPCFCHINATCTLSNPAKFTTPTNKQTFNVTESVGENTTSAEACVLDSGELSLRFALCFSFRHISYYHSFLT